MPSTTITPWGHHLPDPEISRAAAERTLWIAALRESRRARLSRRRTATRPSWADRRRIKIATGATNR